MNSVSSVFVAAILSAGLFSLLLPLSGASGQIPPMPGITIVSGTYTNNAAGVEMTFPAGWEGAAIETDFGLIVSVAKGGMTSDESRTHMMGLMIMDKSKVETPPTDPSEFSADETASDCDTPSITSVQVSGVAGQQIIVQCTQDDVAVKTKMLVVQTDTRWISAVFMAPAAEFDASVSAFDNAVSTLEVRGATAMESTGGNVSLQLRAQSVSLGGENLQVDVRTSSTISQFRLNEETKTLSFRADGQTGTEGTTEIAIGKMLNAPYTVRIDGQSTTDFEVAGTGANAVMTISYTHSAHDFTVTGASVVPEFPIAVVGVIGVLIGVIAVISRTRLFGAKTL